jgi:hypothetical protein
MAFFLLMALGCASDDNHSCFVEVPIYNAVGERMPLSVTKITLASHTPNLLTIPEPEYRFKIVGDRIFFPSQAINNWIKITLNVNGGVITRRIALMACHQRTSLRDGQRDSGADVSTTSVTGRLVGCRFQGDWWIRATPMFGAHEDPASYEGYISPRDGFFSFTSSMRGERHIVVVGRNKTPVKAFAFDVVVGGANRIGDLNLREVCPD